MISVLAPSQVIRLQLMAQILSVSLFLAVGWDWRWECPSQFLPLALRFSAYESLIRETCMVASSMKLDWLAVRADPSES